MNRYKKNSRSRSRSPNHKRKDRQHHHNYNSYKGNQRNRQNRENRQSRQGRDRHRDSTSRNKKRHYSSQSSSSKSSESRKSKSSNQALQIKKQQSQASLQPRYKIQETKTLKIQNCTERQAAQRALTDASITVGTSVPDQVQLKQGSIYIKYPSIQVSSKIRDLLKQKITIKGIEYRINFYPFKKIDLNIAYDWYCDKCEYKNFARRNKCYRCDNQKNNNCRLNYSSSSLITVKNNTNSNIPKEQNINNCSLMIRGPVIMDTQQEILLDLFQSICSVKDIRMIKNKMTGQLKDFAFVQFFTPEQAAQALKQASSPDFRVKGQKVSVMYSRNKSQDQYLKPLPYEKKQRKRDFNKKQKKSDEPIESYYSRQRQLQIQLQKQRPMITMQQLKQKHQQQLKKKAAVGRQLTQQQSKRIQAQLMAKQWQKQAKLQNTIMYICVLCRRKFKGQSEMKAHQLNSEMHKFHKRKLQLSL